LDAYLRQYFYQDDGEDAKKLFRQPIKS